MARPAALSGFFSAGLASRSVRSVHRLTRAVHVKTCTRPIVPRDELVGVVNGVFKESGRGCSVRSLRVSERKYFGRIRVFQDQNVEGSSDDTTPPSQPPFVEEDLKQFMQLLNSSDFSEVQTKARNIQADKVPGVLAAGSYMLEVCQQSSDKVSEDRRAQQLSAIENVCAVLNMALHGSSSSFQLVEFLLGLAPEAPREEVMQQMSEGMARLGVSKQKFTDAIVAFIEKMDGDNEEIEKMIAAEQAKESKDDQRMSMIVAARKETRARLGTLRDIAVDLDED
ncbi:hypothetical protein CYMTET_15184 [Cymbomonas tetramitiformis]|uniref:Uncharacterized protein n=1 Tax=Cymbomonas tetramitiformis TaxID=36881 RepID=A0AAE0GG09_9CHLO|nr:hypothetical protein CYMTET_15184 [Cymbomonas tetramitiformis]